MEFDVIIAGGGIIGLSIALHLAQDGKSVLILEKGKCGMEASSRNGGGLRQQNRSKGEIPLAMASVEFWTRLAADHDFEYVKQGNIRVALEEKDRREMDAAARTMAAFRLEVQVLDKRDTLGLCPYLDESNIRGSSFCPTDGHANPILASRLFRRMAMDRGVQLHENEAIETFSVKKSKVKVITAQESYVGGLLILAAGAWTGELMRRHLQMYFPLRVEASTIAVTEKIQPLYQQFIYREKYGYTRQAVSGNVHLGVHIFAGLFNYERVIPWEAFRKYPRLSRLVPVLNRLHIIHAWTGLTAWTPDKTPIIGWAPGHKNIFICTGMSGHGFSLAPAVGQLVKEMVLDQNLTFDPSEFAPERF